MNSTAADFATKPELQGSRVLLRPYQDDDLPHLLEALSDPEVNRLTGSTHAPGPVTDVVPAAVQQWYESRADQTDRLDLMIVDRDSGNCVGEVVLNAWEPANFSCSFRVLVGPAGQGRGLGTEAIRLLLRYAFTELGLNRISLEVYDFNPRARHVYESVGFVEEGRLRQALRYDDEWVDAIVMSVLRDEWLTSQA